MTRKNGLPRRVYLRHGAYFFVDLDYKWHRLSAERDGLPAMYRALAALTERERTSDRMPAVIARWVAAKREEWAEKTAADQERIADLMSEAFAEFSPAQVTTPICAQYLRRYESQHRTHNMHRTMLRQVLAFAALEGLREGFNPVDNVPTKSTPGRKRAVHDDEIQRVRAAALQQSRNGEGLVRMIDLALATGQRIGDLLQLRWQDVQRDGVHVVQGKTGEYLLIQWTPRLRAAIAACATGDKIGHVLRSERGTGYTYAGIRSAWDRACRRAGVEDLNIHDLRRKAGQMKLGKAGLEEAKELLGHTTVRMTEHYVDGAGPRRVKAN